MPTITRNNVITAFSTAGSRIADKEAKDFADKYGRSFNTNASVAKSGHKMIIVGVIAVIAVVFLPKLLFPDFLGRHEGFSSALFYVLAGGVMFVYWRLIGKQVRQSLKTQEVLDFVNTRESNTTLRVVEGETKGGLGGVASLDIIGGKFRAREMRFVNRMTGSRWHSSKGLEISLALQKTIAADFVVSEKNSTWRRLEGADINDCFAQRFEFAGPEKLYSDELKKLLVNWLGEINLRVESDKLICCGETVKVVNFNTPEGQVLWLDFLERVCVELEKS